MNAFILTGGMSRRFGSDKALAQIHGTSFTEHLFEMLSREFEQVAVVGKVRHFPNLAFVADNCSAQCPLVGIYSGLTSSVAEWNFFLSVDLPLMRTEVIHALKHQIAESLQIIVPKAGERVHPLCGFYHRSLCAPIEHALHEHRYRMMDFIASASAKTVPLNDFESAFFNVNTADAYQQLSRFI
ncbi:Molybdopterin-guanine dinucleotide biosynthesis protein A-like protein [Chloroherpeton thalassium ATCC 35110]|uniref:Probable molybdenum cofactor guanylyltransferase n=1 Tax=Chloroherpeton thalassium (strain ATCC 35110 / GB-78) TaxID=517418 RepID=B3QYY8_CHLT3|nr:molybdenum cofactor guanylyltransferase [Chloroherpeton thalassium]ACF13681.1 Molybdopterin-guanine dinucleotide biosynthesis protein A-like protein [Chloroherpeton thalassium ATCC 35110]